MRPAGKLLCVLFLLTGVCALGAEPPLVVVLSAQDAQAYSLTEESFIASLTSTHQVEVLSVSSKDEPGDLRNRQPTMVVALGSAAVKRAQEIWGDRPLLATLIVSTSSLDELSQATAVVLSTSPKEQLEWHRRILPNARRVGVLYDPVESLEWIEEAKVVAARMGMEIVDVPVSTPQQIPAALKSLARRADSILGIPDRTVYSRLTAKTILLFSFRNRIPFVGMSGAWTKAGALYSLDWDYSGIGRQCASVASRILDGAQASAIEPQQAEAPVYQLNLKTAVQMKIDISSELIKGASGVYQ